MSDDKINIRETFLPDEGCVFVRIDLCLTGDTLIETLRGPKYLKGIEVGEKVLTFRDCRVAWGKVSKKVCTGFNEIWRVTLDDGSTIEGTAEHRFMVVRHWGGRNKGKPTIVEILLKNLKPKDRLVPLRKKVYDGYEVLYSRSALEYSKTHQLVANAYLGERPKGYECHHIDGDKQNNKRSNLEYKEKCKHNRHHAKESFARVNQNKRVRRLRKALKKRDFRGNKNPMFGKLGKNNPNYGKTYKHRQNREKLVCPVCKKEFEAKKSAKRIYCSKTCFVAVQRGRNHKVLKVEKTGRKAQTYSITVEPDHNYALSCGVFVRNSQIEDRMCKMYCGTERMVELANRRPEVYDAHTENARAIFQKDSIDKQERYLGKKCVHACVDDQTEILTPFGFVPFPLATKNDFVAQWDSNGDVIFKKPKQLFEYEYEGRLLFLSSRSSEQLVTPNHKIPHYTRWKDNFDVREASDLKDLYHIKTPVCGELLVAAANTITDDLIRLTVAAQADSFYVDKFYTWRFKKERKIRRLVEILERLRIGFNKRTYNNGITAISINVSNSKKLSFLLDGKIFNWRILNLLKNQRAIFINELKHWDGYAQSDKSFSYTSKDKQSIDVVQAVCCLSGWRAYIGSSPAPYYTLRCHKHETSTVKFEGAVHYKGKVYCVETDSGFFITRRRGKIAITGNSQRKMQGLRMSESVSKDTDGKVFIPPKECDALIRRYLDAMHEIEEIYFPWVEKQVQNVKMLYDSWGGRFDLRNRRVDNELYREAYSWYLQVEAARWTNQYGFIPATWWMLGKYGRPLNMQIHDEIVASVPLVETYEYAQFAVRSFEQTREIPKGSGNTLCVPATVTVGRSMKDERGVEFKALPHRDDFFQELAVGGFFDNGY